MADIKHAGSDDPGNDAFDHFNQVLQDIRDIREQHDSLLLPRVHARPAVAEPESHSDESLPLFLAATDDQGWQPADQDPQQDTWPQDTWPQVTWRQNTLLRETPPQDAHRREASPYDARPHYVWPRDEWQQDDRQDEWPQETERRDHRLQGSWLHAAAEADRERVSAATTPTKRVLKAAILAVPVLALAAGLFAMEDRRAVIATASASLAAILPTFSSSVGQPAPANEQIAAVRVVPVSTVAVPTSREVAPVAPTREAIAVAYQSAVQSQPEIRPAAAPALTPPLRHIDPEELATLLKRAKDLINLGDIVSARLLLRRAADANEATAALILAQTYDPAVLGTADARSIAADPASARHWYEKAASFGSQEALQRLAQM